MTNMIACRGCGKEIHQSTHRCPHCGASQLTSRYKNKAIAGVLAIFLGGLGIHRFYLGQWWGLFYLLLWITGIPSLVSIVEGIVFLATNQQSWDDKHNNGVQMAEGGSSAGIVIAIVVGVMFFMIIPVIGILAAIAIPAYQDYIIRAKVNAVMAGGTAARVYVEEYAINNNAWPREGEVLELPALPSRDGQSSTEVEAIMQANGVIELVITDNHQAIDGKTIELAPDTSGEYFVWSCQGGTLENKYRPAECRN